MNYRQLTFLLFVVAVDCLIIFDSFAVAYLLRFQLQLAPDYWPPEPPYEYLKAMVVVAYFWLLLFKMFGLYEFTRTQSSLDIVSLIVKTVSFGTLIILSLSFFYREFSFSRLVCIYAWVLSILLFCPFRIALNRLQMDFYRAGRSTRRVLLIGSRRTAAFLAGKINGHPELGYRVVGSLDDDPGKASSDLGCEVLGELKDLERVVEEEQVDRVFIAHTALGHHKLLQIIEACERLNVSLGMVPPTYDLMVNYRDFEEIHGIPLLRVNEQENRRAYEVSKRTMDVVLATCALIVLAPLWLVIALLVRLEDGGPAIFTQVRVGKNGRLFQMLKFRTMVVNAEALLSGLVDIDGLNQPVFKLEQDPRITRSQDGGSAKVLHRAVKLLQCHIDDAQKVVCVCKG